MSGSTARSVRFDVPEPPPLELPSLDEIAFRFDQQCEQYPDLNKAYAYECQQCKSMGMRGEVHLRRKDPVNCPRCGAVKVFKPVRPGYTYYSAR
jgi:DNA-directed RNA polymerase subunit RPC12/RpoP